MNKNELTSFAVSNEIKSELFGILEKLEYPQKAIFQAIICFYPNFVSLNFLQETLDLSTKELNRSVDSIYKTLHHRSRFTIKEETGYQLAIREPHPSYFALWSSFSSLQRSVFLSLLTTKDPVANPVDIEEISKKLKGVLPGSIRKNKRGIYKFIPPRGVTIIELAADLKAYLAWEDTLVMPSE